jgi:hypothetical protein
MNVNQQTTEQADIARIRELRRQAYEECTPHITAIANGELEGTTPATRARASEFLAKYARLPVQRTRPSSPPPSQSIQPFIERQRDPD